MHGFFHGLQMTPTVFPVGHFIVGFPQTVRFTLTLERLKLVGLRVFINV